RGKRTGSCGFRQGACDNRVRRQWLRLGAQQSRAAGKFHVKGASAWQACARLRWILLRLELELRQFCEVACSSVYLFELEGAQPVESELLDREAAQPRTIDHRATKCSIGLVASSCEIAHETAGEAVAGAGRIVRLFQRECRHAEDA